MTENKFEIEIIYMTSGVNYHRTDVFTIDDLQNTTIKLDALGGKTFDLDPKGLYRKRRHIFQRMRDRHRGVLDRFLIVYEDGKDEPITPAYRTKEDTVQVITKDKEGKATIHYELPITPKLLDEIERSGILKDAFAKLFQKPVGGAKIIAGFIFLLVVAIAISIYMGWIDLKMLGIRLS